MQSAWLKQNQTVSTPFLILGKFTPAYEHLVTLLFLRTWPKMMAINFLSPVKNRIPFRNECRVKAIESEWKIQSSFQDDRALCSEILTAEAINYQEKHLMAQTLLRLWL